MKRSRRGGIESCRQVIDGQRCSGVAVAAYCRKQEISECSFYNWRRRLRSSVRAGVGTTAPFVEFKTPILSTAEGIEIFLPGERHLLVRRNSIATRLVEVVRTLEGMS